MSLLCQDTLYDIMKEKEVTRWIALIQYHVRKQTLVAVKDVQKKIAIQSITSAWNLNNFTLNSTKKINPRFYGSETEKASTLFLCGRKT